MSSIFSTLLFQKPNVDRQMNDEIRKKILYEYKIEDGSLTKKIAVINEP